MATESNVVQLKQIFDVCWIPRWYDYYLRFKINNDFLNIFFVYQYFFWPSFSQRAVQSLKGVSQAGRAGPISYQLAISIQFNLFTCLALIILIHLSRSWWSVKTYLNFWVFCFKYNLITLMIVLKLQSHIIWNTE